MGQVTFARQAGCGTWLSNLLFLQTMCLAYFLGQSSSSLQMAITRVRFGPD